MADVLYFLAEYGLSVAEKGCVFRWYQFVGVDAPEKDDCHYHSKREWLL